MKLKDRIWYLAGPMTGIPQFNYPLFLKVAETLRAQGFTIQSPAEMDSPETKAAALASVDGAPGTGSANRETWGDFLARDVKLIADGVQGIIVLPNWYRSRGARLEVFVAIGCGYPVLRYHVPSGELIEVDPSEALEDIVDTILETLK